MPACGATSSPDVPRPHGPPPACARLLARDRDEAEVADRGAVGLGVAVDHDDALAAPRRRQGMGEAADAGPDDSEIVGRRSRPILGELAVAGQEAGQGAVLVSLPPRHHAVEPLEPQAAGRRGRRPG